MIFASMKKKVLALCSFIMYAPIHAQVNLVLNPSFEDTISCPSAAAQITRANGWSSYSGTPDYFNSCATLSSQISVPNNFGGYQQAVSGAAYAGFISYGSFLPNMREFIAGTLTAPLSIGIKYYVTFKINLPVNPSMNINCASNNLGVLFSTIAYGSCNGCLPVPKTPQLYISNIVLSMIQLIGLMFQVLLLQIPRIVILFLEIFLKTLAQILL